VRKTLLLLIACAALLAAGCGGGDSTTGEATTGDEAAPAAESSKPKVEVPKGAPPKKLVIKDLRLGSGDEARAGDEVTVQYVGVNYKSGEQFDASWDRGEPFTFALGAGRVIPGWDQGIEGMRVGGRRELIIPPGLAYGQGGTPDGSIPPNETIVFVVDLLAVE
jgi:FKBP-type peptidyl-prolyl cis-trans isomerase